MAESQHCSEIRYFPSVDVSCFFMETSNEIAVFSVGVTFHSILKQSVFDVFQARRLCPGSGGGDYHFALHEFLAFRYESIAAIVCILNKDSK